MCVQREEGVGEDQETCVATPLFALRWLTAPAASDDNAASSSRTRPRLSSHTGDELHDGFDHTASPATYASTLGDNASASPAQDDARGRHHSSSTLANSMMRTVVSSGNDALNILFEAAAAAHNQENGGNEHGAGERGQSAADMDPGSGPSVAGRHSTAGPEVLPKIVRPVELTNASREVLNVWEACRFVKMGWFTSNEAVTFID